MPLNIAREVLKKTRLAYPRGSGNIKSVGYNQRTDSYFLYSSLLETKKRSRTLDALLDPDITTNSLVHSSRNIYKSILPRMARHVDDGIITSQVRRRVTRQLLANESSSRGSGNCEEMSTYVFLQIENKRLDKSNQLISQNELVYVRSPSDIDHTFIVINRPKDSDISNWKTWGEVAIVIDPWINRAFSAPHFNREWSSNNPFGHSPNRWVMSLMFDHEAFWS